MKIGLKCVHIAPEKANTPSSPHLHGTDGKTFIIGIQVRKPESGYLVAGVLPIPHQGRSKRQCFSKYVKPRIIVGFGKMKGEIWVKKCDFPPHPPTLAASDFPSRWEIPFPCCSVKTEEGVRVVSCLLSTHPYRHDGRLLAPQAVDLWRLVDDLEYLKSVSSQT